MAVNLPVALLSLGVLLMIAEVFIPSFGVIGAGGIVAFIAGLFFLADTGIWGFNFSISFLTGVALLCAVFMIIAAVMAARAHKHRIITGREELPGLKGVVTAVGKAQAYADVRGESWRIQSKTPLVPGQPIRVLSVDGLTLHVEPIASGKQQ